MRSRYSSRSNSFATDDENDKKISSTSWICDKYPLISNSWNPFQNLNKNSRNVEKPNKKSSNWRKHAAETILSSSDNEEEDSIVGTTSKHLNQLPKSRINKKHLEDFRNPESTHSMGFEDSTMIAPNVEKLSPSSCVEVHLNSSSDITIILCSVDVLKMRSVFFHNLLEEQEHTKKVHISPNHIWRHPIILTESNPDEAAAFVRVHSNIFCICSQNSFLISSYNRYMRVRLLSKDHGIFIGLN
jgi:hypothetical protein